MKNVHGIFWNWCLLKIQDPKTNTPFRNDLADTLGNLAYEPEHVVDIFKVLVRESDFHARIALSWSSSRALTNMSLAQCQGMIETHIHLFHQLLQHPSQYLRIMTCETIGRLIHQNRVRASSLATFDKFVERMIYEFPNRPEVVEIVLRYLLARRPLYILSQPHLLFPCKGQTCHTWKKAVVYMSKLPFFPVASIALEDAALNAPEKSIAAVVQSFDVDTQMFLVHWIKELWVLEDECVILRALRIISHCHKTPKTTSTMAPLLFDVLEWMDCEERDAISISVWEVCFEMLWSISKRTNGMAVYYPRVLHLLSKWQGYATPAKHAVKQFLANIFQEEPELLQVDMVAHNGFLVDLLPRTFLRSQMDALVSKFSDSTPGPWTLDLVCQMDPAQQTQHSNFLEAHRQYIAESIALSSDYQRRYMVRKQWLAKLPRVLFDACLPPLEDAIITRDITGLLPLFHISPERLDCLKDVLFDQVLGELDIFGHDKCRPSIVLSLFVLLPSTTLESLVHRLVHPRLGETYPILHPTQYLEERLFILKHVSPILVKPYALEIAQRHLHDKRHFIRNLVMEILIHTNETCTYTQWAWRLLTDKTTSVHAQILATTMLESVPPPDVAALLDNHALMDIGVRQACQLLQHVEGVPQYAALERAILFFCEQFPCREECVNLLVPLPDDVIWKRREEILHIADRRTCIASTASKRLLTRLASVGMTVAKELLAKYEFQDTLF